MKKKAILTFAIVIAVCCTVIFAACDNKNQQEQARNEEFKQIALLTVGAQDQKIDYATVTQKGTGSFVVEIEIHQI